MEGQPPERVFERRWTMDEAARRRLPWGTLLTLAGLAGILCLVLRSAPGSGRASWESVAAAVTASSALFLVMRWQQNYVWGVVAALALPLQPLYWRWVHQPAQAPALLAEAMELVALAGVVACWQLTFQPRVSWLSWGLAAAGLCVGSALAWPAQPRAGLVTALLA